MAFFGYPIICKEQTSQAVLFFWMTSWLFNQKEGLFVHVTDGCCSPRPAIQPFFRVKPVGDWFGKSQDATYPIQNSRSLTESCFGRTNGEFCSVFFFIFGLPPRCDPGNRIWRKMERKRMAQLTIHHLKKVAIQSGALEILCKVRDGRFSSHECPRAKKTWSPRLKNLRECLWKTHTFYNVTQTCDIHGDNRPTWSPGVQALVSPPRLGS